jgi:hypothetical protein
MAPSTPTTASPRATLLVLNDLKPLRHGLQRVFRHLDDPAATALERHVQLCGSAPVFVGSADEARSHAGQLGCLGITTSVNVAIDAPAPVQGMDPAA